MTRRQIMLNFALGSSMAILGPWAVLKNPLAYKVVIHNKPKTNSDGFSTVDDFWAHNQDAYGEQLNAEFMRQGKLREVVSHLSKDKKSLILVKYYRSKQDYLEYLALLKQHHSQAGFSEKVKSRSFFSHV